MTVLEQTIRTRNELQRAAGVELAATCHICLKTKFADGVGHSCHYCRVRCCARCGGKVTLRSNKVSKTRLGSVFDWTFVCKGARHRVFTNGIDTYRLSGYAFCAVKSKSFYRKPVNGSTKTLGKILCYGEWKTICEVCPRRSRPL